ncbi:MAG: hypothetical protein J7621_06095 [Niastella sp.]|nr:hypothetical protein [Niastella sp.]
MKNQYYGIDILIDKLTNSIENTISGDSFKTDVLPVTANDLKRIKKKDWSFDWHKEWQDAKKQLFKLVIRDSLNIVQGLISIEDRGDHIFMHLIESAKFNKGIKKLYVGVPGNLVAFACKISFEKGYEGFISFESKTKLIAHYKKSLGAFVIAGQLMGLDTSASLTLIHKYFPDN